MVSRRTAVTLIYQDKDITADVSGDLTSATYEEGFGQADTVDIALQDRRYKWLLSWRPQTGESLQMDIGVTNWTEIGDNRKLQCGKFLVDELEYAAPPRTLNLRGNSLPSDSSFIGIPHSRTWADVTLKDQILSMLPKSLSLSWQTKFNIKLVKAEQSNTADLEYIQNQCTKYGLRLKLLNNRLVVFSARELDAQPPVRTFHPVDLGGYTLRHTTTRTQYDACKVKYQNAAQGKEITYTYPQGGSPHKVYEVTEAVYSIAEAESVAKAALWTQNMVSNTCEITLPIGDTKLYAGRNIALEGFGDFDGVYGIDASSHTVDSGGYSTSISLHKVIVEEIPEQEEPQDIKVGDTVNFSGGNHYTTSIDTAPVGGMRTAGTAKVTNIAASAPHPYHLIGITSNVYGWVDKSTVSKG